MIVGILLRHYKVFRGISFIPLCDNYSDKFILIIGNNGVGKSSVLEALNAFFNNSYWNKTKGEKPNESFVAPIFLIEKSKLSSKFNKNSNDYKFLETLSYYFWNVKDDANNNLKKEEFQSFFKYRDSLKQSYSEDEFFFFLLGVRLENSNKTEKRKAYFSTFDNHFLENLPDDLKKYDQNRFLESIRNLFSYLYIPIESKVGDVLKLETQEMQTLMNRDILNNIDDILNEREFENPRAQKKQGKKSLVDILNILLDEYMNEINETIQGIDGNYEFKVESGPGKKRNLSSLDIRNKILEAYFSIRTLKKEKKEIFELSSGEQRLALIDIATAFLMNSANTDKDIILAIDEPETSLHISKCFNQFERLESLSKNNQVLLTTHWYGSLPITKKGNLQHFSFENNNIKVKAFSFNNYFEERKRLPHDIMIKSYFELTSSILSSMRNEKNNWIICEGSSDKIYLEHYLKDKVKNLKVFAVKGEASVIKLFNYLLLPVEEIDEIEELESKTLCLIDSDNKIIESIDKNQIKAKKHKTVKLQISRLQRNESSKEIDLCDFKKRDYYPTEIEDGLHPETYYKAIEKSILEENDSSLIEIFNNFEFNNEIEFSTVKGEKSILKPLNVEAIELKEKLYHYLDNSYNKFKISKEYIKLSEPSSPVPSIFEKISSFFNT